MNCSHGMPTPASCFECMMEGIIEPKKSTEVTYNGDPFPATYEGWCALGHDTIYPEDMICSLGDGGYAHEECLEAA